MPARSFWRPPLWKWIVFLVFLAATVVLARWKPAPRPVEIELLLITDSFPPWDGSYPSAVISVTSDSGRVRFKNCISLTKPTVQHDLPVNQFEVALDSGMFKLRQTDIFVADVMPLSLTRTYRVWVSDTQAFGVGGNHPYDIWPSGTTFPYTYMNLNLEDVRQIYFPRISKGTRYEDAIYRNGNAGSEFYDARIRWNGDGWTLNFHDGREFLFPESYHAKNSAQGAPFEMRDEHGNRIQLKRNKVRDLQQLISPSGHTITFKYDDASRIVEAQDDAGTIRKYTYNPSGHLETVSDDAHALYRFEYEPLLHERGYDPFLMTAVLDGKGRVLLKNVYRDGSRVSEQRLANGDVYRYNYLFDKKHIVIQTTVTPPSGEPERFSFYNGIRYADYTVK
jgi:YD repeat-containing protein